MLKTELPHSREPDVELRSWANCTIWPDYGLLYPFPDAACIVVRCLERGPDPGARLVYRVQ